MDENALDRTRFNLLEALFARAQEIPAEERPQAIAAWCGGDADLLEDLKELLHSDQDVETKIATAGTQERDARLRHAPNTSIEAWIGRELGPFRIERLLGEGGMGTVFFARRFGGNFEQDVAIKVIARRVYSHADMQQFYAERDALAKMQHPNIARLLDASFAEEGQPYVVMEYIDGIPLHRACDDAFASSAEKLGWIKQLCDAVDSVHRLLILHRDLKPANVLVTTDGMVKLLDFGTAKLLAPEYGDSAMTQAGIRPMTLRYASPEQMAGAPLTTASDVYSLGVVLYRILSGETPDIEQRGNLASPSVARKRAHRPAFCASKRLCGDLDAIVLKAMQPAPEDRYASAGKIAEDIRSAEAFLPISATREGWTGRSLRFARRQWKSVVTTAILLLAMAVGILAVHHQSELERESLARNQHGLAQEQALAHMLLFDFFEQLKSIPGSTNLQRQTVSKATAYLDRIAAAQHNQDAATLREDAVDAYTKMGNLLGNPYEENLGDTQGAIMTLQKAVSLARLLHDQAPNDIPRTEALSIAEQSLGRVYFTSGRPKDALEPMMAAADAAKQIADHPQATSEQMAQSASMFDSLGDLYGLPAAANLNDLGKARIAYEKALALDQRGFAKEPSCLRCQRGVAIESWKLGGITKYSDPSFALSSLRRGLDTIAAMPAAEQTSAKTRRIDNILRDTLGVLQLHMGDPRASLATLAPVHERFSEAIRLDPIDDRARFDRGALNLDIGEAHGALGEWKDAADSYEEALTDATALVEKDESNPQWKTVRARALIGLGNARKHLGDAHGTAQLREGITLAITTAERSDSDADALSLAADSILDHPQLIQDAGGLALRFAEQSIAASGTATKEQKDTLEKAKALAKKNQRVPGGS